MRHRIRHVTGRLPVMAGQTRIRLIPVTHRSIGASLIIDLSVKGASSFGELLKRSSSCSCIFKAVYQWRKINHFWTSKIWKPESTWCFFPPCESPQLLVGSKQRRWHFSFLLICFKNITVRKFLSCRLKSILKKWFNLVKLLSFILN